MLIKSVLCFFGHHQWGDWKFVSDNFSFSLWDGKNSPGKCTEESKCTLCPKTQTRSQTEHKWSEIVFVSADKCDQMATCLICSSNLTLRDQHTWGSWEQIRPCNFTTVCSRCQQTTTSVQHDYVNGCPCRRCGQGHEWVPVSSREEIDGEVYRAGVYLDHYSTITTYRCIHCSEETES